MIPSTLALAVAAILGWMSCVAILMMAVRTPRVPARICSDTFALKRQPTAEASLPPPSVDVTRLEVALTRTLTGRHAALQAQYGFSQTAACLWRMDADGRITHTTGRALERYGVVPEQVTGTNIAEWPHPDAWRAAKAALETDPNITVVVDCPDWLLPSRVTYGRLPDGSFVGIAVPAPDDHDRVIWEAS